jgi:hypothetical protein
MDAVHGFGTATVREITNALPDPPTEDSIRAILRIPERKGRLVRREADGKLAYAASESPKAAGRSALKRVVNTFFGGIASCAVGLGAARCLDQLRVVQTRIARRAYRVARRRLDFPGNQICPKRIRTVDRRRT